MNVVGSQPDEVAQASTSTDLFNLGASLTSIVTPSSISSSAVFTSTILSTTTARATPSTTTALVVAAAQTVTVFVAPRPTSGILGPSRDRDDDDEEDDDDKHKVSSTHILSFHTT